MWVLQFLPHGVKFLPDEISTIRIGCHIDEYDSTVYICYLSRVGISGQKEQSANHNEGRIYSNVHEELFNIEESKFMIYHY